MDEHVLCSEKKKAEKAENTREGIKKWKYATQQNRIFTL